MNILSYRYLIIWLMGLSLSLPLLAKNNQDYEQARWHPLHFKPAIEKAKDQQCLACHPEILKQRVKKISPAGIKTDNVLAWYQTLDVYQGEQETFHRRHLVTPLAKKLMNLRCNTCHEGHDPREEAPNPPNFKDAGFTLRKTVNPEKTCLKCHGQMNYFRMGLPAPWEESKKFMNNSCLLCHTVIRTTRHQVNYLNPEAIEEAAKENSDICYGCHGGRAWYRITYPYPRHTWPGMANTIPDWAKDRPTESEARFRLAK